MRRARRLQLASHEDAAILLLHLPAIERIERRPSLHPACCEIEADMVPGAANAAADEHAIDEMAMVMRTQCGNGKAFLTALDDQNLLFSHVAGEHSWWRPEKALVERQTGGGYQPLPHGG